MTDTSTTADRALLAHVLDSMSQQVRTTPTTADLVPTAPFATPQRADVPADVPTPGDQPDPAAASTSSGGPMTVTAGGDVGALMRAMTSGVESHGDPNVENPRTHAHGAWQIMPGNWEPWAKAAGVDPADRSLDAQARVVEHVMSGYLSTFGSIDAVAVAWYAGPAAAKAWLKDPNAARFNKKQGKGDEPSINEYVGRIRAAIGAGNA